MWGKLITGALALLGVTSIVDPNNSTGVDVFNGFGSIGTILNIALIAVSVVVLVKLFKKN